MAGEAATSISRPRAYGPTNLYNDTSAVMGDVIYNISHIHHHTHYSSLQAPSQTVSQHGHSDDRTTRCLKCNNSQSSGENLVQRAESPTLDHHRPSFRQQNPEDQGLLCSLLHENACPPELKPYSSRNDFACHTQAEDSSSSEKVVNIFNKLDMIRVVTIVTTVFLAGTVAISVFRRVA